VASSLSEINVVPLVDVMLVLLIIFMVTAPMLTAGMHVELPQASTAKPVDVAAVVAAADRTGRVITVEEHSVIGGLGGAVAETLSQHRPTRVDRIGLQDEFVQSGPNDALLDIYGLSATRVTEQVLRILRAGD